MRVYYMTEKDRIKKVIFWLISQDIIKNQEDLAHRMGYNPSSLSQIVTGIKPLSKKFARKLASISDKINIDYLFGGDDMLKKSKVVQQQDLTKDIQANDMSMLIQVIHSQQKTIEMLAEKVVASK